MTADTRRAILHPAPCPEGGPGHHARQRRPARPQPTTTATETGTMILAVYILTLMLGSIGYAIWTEIDQHGNDR